MRASKRHFNRVSEVLSRRILKSDPAGFKGHRGSWSLTHYGPMYQPVVSPSSRDSPGGLLAANQTTSPKKAVKKKHSATAQMSSACSSGLLDLSVFLTGPLGLRDGTPLAWKLKKVAITSPPHRPPIPHKDAPTTQSSAEAILANFVANPGNGNWVVRGTLLPSFSVDQSQISTSFLPLPLSAILPRTKTSGECDRH